MLWLIVSAPPLARAAESCQSFVVSGEVRGGESYRRIVGPGLVFGLLPSGDVGGGWSFAMGPSDSAKVGGLDYIGLVTPPYRSRLATSLDTSYGVLAQSVVEKREIEFWFLLNREDAAKAGYAVGQLIFSSPVQSEERSLEQLRALPKGKGVFRVIGGDAIAGVAAPGQPLPPDPGYPDDETLERLYGRIERIAFEVRLTVPKGYRVPETFSSQAAPCPGAWIL
ncbi:hypothetical protein ED208_06855 [Stagnimonas aquatica]|uniref:Uncharacterized protein n=1 Tax=Stagnimonas aquatica TaxID=2689987 RepID=A0A3N0VH90_9GAMM|nr:hypothetical protein [Stagnimonas aquatica]ROH92082.1 hypothetical protein ED208_06855 [Stagnimonas aquatica]